MAKIGLVNNLWVLVCDGRKALLFQNVGDRAYPKFETRETFQHETLRTRDLGTDEPGRVWSSAAGRRATVEPTDFHALEEAQFLADLARHLDRFAADHKIKDLVIAAPPRALGTLRDALSQSVRALVRAEIGKDYVAQPVFEIERHLAKALAE